MRAQEKYYAIKLTRNQKKYLKEIGFEIEEVEDVT